MDCHGKYYSVTTAGGLGFSALAMQEGDQVCYLGSNGKYLQVLSSDCRRYLTHAWLDGMMGDDLVEHITDPEACESFCLE